MKKMILEMFSEHGEEAVISAMREAQKEAHAQERAELRAFRDSLIAQKKTLRYAMDVTAEAIKNENNA